MSEGARNFHFNVNNRDSGGSKAQMANNEDSFLRAMEIQDRKREIKELARLEEERLAALNAPEVVEPEVSEEPDAQEEVAEAVEAPVETAPAAEAPAPAAPKKPSGNFVPGPTPRNDFTDDEKAAMLKRARAFAAEVAARK